jgi:fructose-1,6-bisphosphatase/inositol monophosphatase family enzyme
VIVIPALDERVYAAVGHGAWYAHGDRPPQPARVSARSLGAGLFVTSEVANFEKVGRRAAYDRLQAAARLARSWGDGYGYLMVATGRAEVMVDPVVSVWDVAALAPIIEEAGGVFSDWQGLRSTRSGNAVATNAAAQAEVMKILAGATSPLPEGGN